MSPFLLVRSLSARKLILRVCTENPFYVISAGLFLTGLWISFGAQQHAADTWALVSGLAGYTLLLAVTACLLVRFGNVWDDVRTVLLLVVLMFLATSVTFDEPLLEDPLRGIISYLGGLLFAVGVSESLLRGIRLRLPAWFRGPYYLILGLFFLYPLALSALEGESLLWCLFGFSFAAGLVFLALLPAIRRGPDYVRDNGSPWTWPLYPWALFGLLASAVPARAFLLSWSMHLPDGGNFFRVIFGFYFLVPFGFAVAILLMELSLVSRHRVLQVIALMVPGILIGLAVIGHREDPIYQGFLSMFAFRLGSYPLFLTAVVAVTFHLYAAGRRMHGATEALTVSLAALACVRPDTLYLTEATVLEPAPILAAALLQLGLGLWRRSSWRCLLGVAGLVLVGTLILPPDEVFSGLGQIIAYHLAMLAVFIVGGAFDDVLARLLRYLGIVLALLACLVAIFAWIELPTHIPPWVVDAYPPVLALLLLGYGVCLGHAPTLTTAGVVMVTWLVVGGGRAYLALRQIVTGLDYLVVSLAVFVVAFAISLGKAGKRLPRIAATGQDEQLSP